MVALHAAELQEAVAVEIHSTQNAAVPLLIGCIGASDSLKALADILQHDLSFTEQFAMKSQDFSAVPTKQEFADFAKKGIPLILFLSRSDDNSIEWRLYDTFQPKMIKGKRYVPNISVVRAQAHAIADMVWPELTGQEGFFSSRIAYCKQVKGNVKRPARHIYIADYDGSNEELLVGTRTMKIAPRWNKDKNNPLVSYSECRRSNTVLAYATMNGKRFRAVDFDGINMLLSFADAGDRAVYCSSRGRGYCQIYYCAPGVFKQITNNSGNNISPVLSVDGNKIYFCSDYKRTMPGIFTYDMQTGKMEELISDGYCVSPAYSARANKLAYAKMVKGTLQIFVYDLKNNTQEQVTFSAGDKEECSWSPCGNYLLYPVAKGNTSRLAMLCLKTRTERWLTSAAEDCSYPSWSPFYEKFPLVNKK